MKRMLALSAFALFASSAFAGTIGSVFSGGAKTPTTPDNVQGGERSGIVVPFDVAGVHSWDLLGDPSNEVYVFDVAAAIGAGSGNPASMNGIGWDVTIQALGASWMSEASVYFDDTIAPDYYGLFLTPGAGYSYPGTGTFSSGGILKLSDYGIPDVVLPDGKLRLEFYEGFDDVADGIDANWLSGALFIQAVPEPASLALLALGALFIRRR